MLMDDRQKREEEFAEDRRRREEEAAAERHRQQEQIERLMRLVETTSRTRDDSRPPLITTEKVKLSKLTEQDDIGAFLTTFER